MPMDETGAEQAVKAFYRNDPFYPRPGRDSINDQKLWQEFKDRFLNASAAMFEEGSSKAHLPALFIRLVEQGA